MQEMYGNEQRELMCWSVSVCPLDDWRRSRRFHRIPGCRDHCRATKGDLDKINITAIVSTAGVFSHRRKNFPRNFNTRVKILPVSSPERDPCSTTNTYLGYPSWNTAVPSSLPLTSLTSIICLQGTAAFWFNLLKSGESDGTTRHAGCPVIVGTKWGKSLCSVRKLETCCLVPSAVVFHR